MRNGSSDGCSTTSWRRGPSRLATRPARSLQGRMASLHDLYRALFPTARPLGATELAPERAERDVGWVRVLKPRVPAFEALETGDLAIIPGAALAVVAPRAAQVEELAVALARARVPAVLLVDGETGADVLDALGEALTAAGSTALRLGRVDPVRSE